MAGIVNTIKRQIDLPAWEQLRLPPAVSSAVSATCMTASPNFNSQHGRYIYYMIASGQFWRYDTWMDSYEQLSSPPIAPATFSTMRFIGTMGLEGLVLAGGSNTMTIPAYYGQAVKGFDVIIQSGTGAGQRRTITYVAPPTQYDFGVPTAVNNVLGALTITDTTKNWAFNQWAGYQVRIIFGTGVSQVRRILYNSATVLTLGDSVKSAEEVLCNPNITSPAIVSTAGSQSIYAIEASVVTVDSPWATQPDATSFFRIYSGAIQYVTSNASSPFYALQQYDVISDTWYIRTANSLNIAAVGTDSALEATPEEASVWVRGQSQAAGTTTTLVDGSWAWTTNQWAGYWVRILSGTGEGQIRQIVSNTSSTLTWTTAGTAPDTTSQYQIEGFPGGAGVATSTSSTTITDSTQAWTINRWANYSVRIIYGTGKGQVLPIISNTSTTLTVAQPFGVTPDTTSEYMIIGDPDKMYLMLGGNAATLILNLNDDLGTYGRWNDGGVARQGTITYAGKRPLAISTITFSTTTATVTTVNNHGLKTGWSCTIAGATGADASKYNGTFVITVTGLTTFTYTMTGTPGSNAVFTGHSTTTLTDASKNWTANQWAGYMCYMTTTAVTAATGVATGQALQVVSNTATTLTFVVAGTAPTNGVSRYVMTPRSVMGTMDHGIATGSQSTTTLQDTTKVATITGGINSGINGTAGNILNITSIAGTVSIGCSITGTGVTAGTVITGFTSGTYGGIGIYTVSINSNVNSGSSLSSGWVTNYYAGRKVKFLSATGQSQELTITSNTNNTLTFGAATAPVSGATSYAILQAPVRGTGVELKWGFGISDTTLRGKLMYIARGSAALGFDRYDITLDQWDLSAVTPQFETLTTGSMYSYDLQDRLYFTKEVTQRMYYLDMVTGIIHGAGIYPYIAGTAIIGNRMEIFVTFDGIKYLWLNRHSNLECFRALLIQ